MKISKTIKAVYFLALTIFWVVFISISSFFISLKPNTNSKKACILAGYASGSITDYRLEVYPDSTFYLSTIRLDETNKTWERKLDTLFLMEDLQLCAKIINLETVEIIEASYHSLSIMELKAFSPPKIIQYPKGN
jgi:hypothetical protein